MGLQEASTTQQLNKFPIGSTISSLLFPSLAGYLVVWLSVYGRYNIYSMCGESVQAFIHHIYCCNVCPVCARSRRRMMGSPGAARLRAAPCALELVALRSMEPIPRPPLSPTDLGGTGADTRAGSYRGASARPQQTPPPPR